MLHFTAGLRCICPASHTSRALGTEIFSLNIRNCLGEAGSVTYPLQTKPRTVHLVLVSRRVGSTRDDALDAIHERVHFFE